jgi:hypothetical protein
VKEFKFDIEKVNMLRRETGPETEFNKNKSASQLQDFINVVIDYA